MGSCGTAVSLLSRKSQQHILKVVMHSLFPVFGVHGHHHTNNTGKKFYSAFPVKRMCCTHDLDPTYALLTGKRSKLARLRRQKKRSENYFRTLSHGLPLNRLFLASFFFIFDWKKIQPQPFSGWEKQQPKPPLSLHYLHRIFTIWVLTEGTCMSETASSSETLLTGKTCINGWLQTDFFWGLHTVVVQCQT